MRAAPRAIDVRLLTPRNHWFGLRHERARCELEESSRSNLTDPTRAERRKKQADRQCWKRRPGTAETLREEVRRPGVKQGTRAQPSDTVDLDKPTGRSGPGVL
ncbi:hypothetical protein NDU88_004627 [Pleurodeles waltl]|uniref:Uncharacterized protein n=1 Tax=Pleurodeles waltl TaxID=8319 RepID=A0AAV7M6U4_PLEWA|nr:hypothetical protein NDU88_004627 [Pleurodeles waltl]